jgi:hypothetical protein
MKISMTIDIDESLLQRVLSSLTVRLAEEESDGDVAWSPPSFREGSKRAMAYTALTGPGGVSIDDGMALLGWDANTTQSQFYEIARLTRRPLVNTKIDGRKVFSLGEVSEN